MRNTKTIKVSTEAWTACVRFWILRAAIIVIGGLILGHFLSQAVAASDDKSTKPQIYNNQ